MAYKKPAAPVTGTRPKKRGRRPRSTATWLQYFPWCRSAQSFDSLQGPPTARATDRFGYPDGLTHGYFMIDHARLLSFMRHAWNLEMTDSDLNLLEFHGLVIPVRKAITEGLEWERIDAKVRGGRNIHHPLMEWHHRARGVRDLPADIRGPLGLMHHDFDRHEVYAQLGRLPMIPTPVLLLRHKSTFYPERVGNRTGAGGKVISRFARSIDPIRPSEIFCPEDLKKMRRWLRPCDIMYWSVLARDQECAADWPEPRHSGSQHGLRDLVGTDPERVLRLRESTAMCGNQGVVRFYIIGAMTGAVTGYSRSQTGFGAGFGQDWYIANIIQRLRGRMSLAEMIQQESSCQHANINQKPSIQREHMLVRRGLAKILPLPRIHDHFHRNVVLALLQNARNPEAYTAPEWLKRLGRAAKIEPTPGNVRRIAGAGRTSLNL